MEGEIHFIGIGGVGMAGLAALLKARGHAVSGCDVHLSPRTRWLESLGVAVAEGHSPSHLDAAGTSVSTVVVTPAVRVDNPEFVAARARSHVRYRGEVLAEIVSACDGVAVCGTHGKTTTSTFAAKLLAALGDAPGWCIGGETGPMPVADAGTAFASGPERGPLVVEADESDGTLALYHPATLVLNAVDFDHLEHFAGEGAYFDCYRTALNNTRRCVIVCSDHPRALELARAARSPGVMLVTFGLGAAPEGDLRPGDFHVSAAEWPQLRSLVAGEHNVRNALAAIAVARTRGHSSAAISSRLPEALALLPDRRFERVHPPYGTEAANAGGVEVYTDYAHHPAELACAVRMAASRGAARVRVIFQPHRYSRTKALLRDFPPAFDLADEVVLVPVYAAFEEPIPGGDIADLYRAFRSRGVGGRVLLARGVEEAWRHVLLTLRGGDLVLIAGAGDIVRMLPRVRDDLAARSVCPPPVASIPVELSRYSFFRTGGVTYGRVCATASEARAGALVLGQGSNTWISDLATDADVVKLPDAVPAGRPGSSLLATHPELAFMAGIPGTLGGWVRMNAGAFGHAIGECVESVTLADGRVLSADECGFSYRHSAIDGVIVDVAFKPRAEGDVGSPADFLSRRRAFPARCCGSVFKNPSGDFAGRLLEAAGAKEMRVGGASVWSEHANVIVAEDGCTSSDILALSRLMALAVRHRFDVGLEPEIRGL